MLADVRAVRRDEEPPFATARMAESDERTRAYGRAIPDGPPVGAPFPGASPSAIAMPAAPAASTGPLPISRLRARTPRFGRGRRGRRVRRGRRSSPSSAWWGCSSSAWGSGRCCCSGAPATRALATPATVPRRRRGPSRTSRRLGPPWRSRPTPPAARQASLAPARAAPRETSRRAASSRAATRPAAGRAAPIETPARATAPVTASLPVRGARCVARRALTAAPPTAAMRRRARWPAVQGAQSPARTSTSASSSWATGAS